MDALPNTTYAEPESVRALLSALGAPTSASGRPSPFTSPGAPTVQPAPSFAAAPSIRKPPAPSAPRSTVSVDALPNTTYAEPESVRMLLSAIQAPTITSASPSPFTSPRPATDWPAWSFVTTPSIRKPAPPSAPRSTVAGDGLPNMTYAEPDSFAPLLLARSAPTITSPTPSPLTSPAGATE